MKKIIFVCLLPLFASAKDYPASLFGIRGDGITLNTRSIQYALDYIHAKGGGTLVFEVGRCLTGSLHLRSNVNIQLKEGAVLLGSLNPFDYERQGFATALLLGKDEHDISIYGNGIIDGQGREVAFNTAALVQGGVIDDPMRHGRPSEGIRPMLLYLRQCRNITLQNVTLRNSASWVQTYDQVTHLLLEDIAVDSKAFWNNDGVDIVDCDSVTVRHAFIDAADDGICLKSHEDQVHCSNIVIEGNTIRSSANAIKFGTASRGGFRHVRITNNTVFDTYRSALALESVDGGFLDDVVVDSLKALHTGNAVFIRLGERVKGRKGSLSNIKISRVLVEIASDKPDAGYAYEGPVEDQPRNISPIVIAGLPGQYISDVHLSGIEVRYPGGGNPQFANAPLDKLDSINELDDSYPDFSMFRELPAWGMYVRHVKGLDCSGITLNAGKKDYRVPVVLDDVQGAVFRAVKATQPNMPKEKVHAYRSSGINIR